MRINADHPKFSRTRCWVDGTEVTDRCFEADETEGWADCYVVGASELTVLEAGEMKTKRLRGLVRFKFD